MSAPGSATRQSQRWHWAALAAGLVATVSFIAAPGGIVGYFVMLVIGVGAVVIGHWALRYRGPLRWFAIVGLALAYIQVISAIGLIVVRLTRTLAG